LNIIKEADFRKQIKSAPEKCYLFFGEEEYMKNYALKLAKQTISPDPTLAFFNELSLDGLTYSPSALLDAIMPAPMMAERKIVIVQGLDFTGMKSGDVDDLCQSLDSLDEYDYNTVIISVAPDKIDTGILPHRPSAILQRLSEYAVCVNFEKNTPARLASWISKHFEHNGVTATPNVCMALIDRCGRDMYSLASETDKLSFYALSYGKNTVTLQDVAQVAIAAMEYDAFAFTNSIAARKQKEALDILYDMKSRRLEPIIIMSKVTETACDMLSVAVLMRDGLTCKEISRVLKMHEFRVSKLMGAQVSEQLCRHMISACKKADLQIKSYGGGYEILERLICTI